MLTSDVIGGVERVDQIHLCLALSLLVHFLLVPKHRGEVPAELHQGIPQRLEPVVVEADSEHVDEGVGLDAPFRLAVQLELFQHSPQYEEQGLEKGVRIPPIHPIHILHTIVASLEDYDIDSLMRVAAAAQLQVDVREFSCMALFVQVDVVEVQGFLMLSQRFVYGM